MNLIILLLQTVIVWHMEVGCHVANGSQQLCLTEDCVMAAATILESLNRRADPCEDFYEFACGGWIQRSITSDTDSFTLVGKRNQNLIKKKLMEEEDDDDLPKTARQKAKDFYVSCIGIGSSNDAEILRNFQDLAAIINYVGSWSFTTNERTRRRGQVMSFDEKLRLLHNNLGLDALFAWTIVEREGTNHMAVVAGGWEDATTAVDYDEYLNVMATYTALLASVEKLEDLVADPKGDANDETDENEDTALDVVLSVFDPSTWLGSLLSDRSIRITDSEDTFEDFLKKRRSLETSFSLNVADTLTIVEDARGVAPNLVSSLDKVIKFQQSLANITSKPQWDSNSIALLKPYSVARMLFRFPFVNWKQFFTSIPQVGYDSQVLVQVEFLEGVNRLVQKYQATEEGRDTLRNYLIWRLVETFSGYQPIEEKVQIEENCLKEIEYMFAPVVTAIYVREKGVKELMEVVTEAKDMLRFLKMTFEENFAMSSWMSKKSVETATDKLDQMVNLVGFPEEFILNSTRVDGLFADLEIKRDAYLLNVVSHRAFDRQLELKRYSTPIDRTGWNAFSRMPKIGTVNAYYKYDANAMFVPVGILQPPFFWPRPKSLLFGTFGFLMAHEIAHAFDHVGILHDSEGLYNRPIYDNATTEKFHEASDCIRKQYSEYGVGGKNNFLQVDGNVTLGENIADHGGVEISEMAYERWLEEDRRNGIDDVTLPALQSFTNRQLFYLGYASLWCATHTDSFLESEVIKDVHAPDRFRVIGPLSNSRSFARAWKCKKNSTMNKPNKLFQGLTLGADTRSRMSKNITATYS